MPRNNEVDERILDEDEPIAAEKSGTAEISTAKKLETEQESRREERFLWILGVVILLDIMLLKDVENWSLPLVVLVLEMVGAVFLAAKYKIGTVQEFIDKLVASLPMGKGGG